MIRKPTAGFLGLLTILLAGCGALPNGGSELASLEAGTATVRVVHASPNAPAVDILVDGGVAFTEVPYLAFSPRVALPAGERNFKVNAAGTDITVIDVSPTLEAGADYTVIAMGFLADIEPLLLEDDLSLSVPGRAKLRLVHGAPSAPAVDIYLSRPGQPLRLLQPVATAVPFKAATGFLELTPGAYRVRITVAGTDTVAIDTGTLTLAPGSVLTAVAVDAPGGGGPFGVLAIPE